MKKWAFFLPVAALLFGACRAAGASLPTGAITAPTAARSCLSAPYDLAFSPNLDRPLPPVYFCGEAVPLHEEAVARRLIAALARNNTQTAALFRMRQRAASFFPVIEPILARYHIPADFKFLPLVESSLMGRAVSPKGAAGYWQFMPATARELGLAVGNGVDERLDLDKSTHAACRYLQYLHRQLGSWTLAAAAYNNGIGNLLGSIRRQQHRNYYYLRLNAETGKYLYRILAFKELFNNYQQYGNQLPQQLLASLRKPVEQEALSQAENVLFDEGLMVSLEKQAILAAPNPKADFSTPDERPDDLPLPNAADVFRGGIKAKLVEAGALQRGGVWVFNLTRNGIANDVAVTEGDRLYAIVEDIDTQTGRIYFRADKLYTAGSQQTMVLPLAAVDASTGRMGIKIPDVDQMKAGWTLTWKAL
ncbi:lytic transglycosylase domain-containing protein [Fibrella aquatilis]|uniref:Lytic transglycosylase domain-containing protein n=1 Tax=Fibrella aquatilis TaxID=2817059 RepID=A0A939GAF9_9BACT|nr:lytic transglycosylase domain-containing protein [Fibrella aquatilis]MBO0933036.1 lytic transglycosylase domain-containing protein [Fibrella aquatilis]